MNLESPWEFDIKKNNGGVEVVFSDLMEFAQAAPVVGNLMINGQVMTGRYGGPVLIENGYLYAPICVKRFCGTVFKIVKINCTTYESEYIGRLRHLIWLDRIEDGKIHFFDHINKSILNSYDVTN